MNADELIFKILEGKEKRALRQRELLKTYKNTLISFTLNIPGIYKLSDKYKLVFNEGINLIEKTLKSENIKVIYSEKIERESGYEFFCLVDSPAKEIKKHMINIEYVSLLGRLFDIDVFDKNGELLSRANFNIGKRKCLVCEKDAVVCSRERAHRIEEVIRAIDILIYKFIKENTNV